MDSEEVIKVEQSIWDKLLSRQYYLAVDKAKKGGDYSAYLKCYIDKNGKLVVDWESFYIKALKGGEA